MSWQVVVIIIFFISLLNQYENKKSMLWYDLSFAVLLKMEFLVICS